MKNLKYIFFAACLLMLNAVISAQTVYTVTKSTDPDPFVYPYDFNDTICSSEMYGTLQWAIRKANDTEGQCRIVFNIPGQAPHTIPLEYYLPQITNSVSIDATTQSGYTEENPSIIIDGQNLISTAFYVFEADSIEIKGFRINRMKSTGILLYYCNNAIISDNIITLPNANYNVSKTGFSRIIIMQSSNIYVYNNLLDAYVDGIPTPEPYNYGIAVYWTTNCFIGDTLTNKQNSILDCYNGVYIDTACQSVKISGNIIDVSSDGIALSSGSNNDKKAPMILRYEEGILKGVGVAGDIIEAFGSTGPEKSMAYLGTATTDSVGNWALSAETGYDYFISTATDSNNNTSKFCNVVLSNPTCAFPINLSSSAGLSTTHTLSWEGTVGTTYGIVVGLKSLTPLDNNWTVSYNQTTADSIVISGLDQNTEYEYYINSRCGTEVSYWAGPLEFNIPFVIVPETTKLTNEYCGATVYSNDTIQAIPLNNVIGYKFWVMNENTGEIIEFESENSFIVLDDIFNSTYTQTTFLVKIKCIYTGLQSEFGDTCVLNVITSILKPEIFEMNGNLAVCGYSPEWAVYCNSQQARDSIELLTQNTKIGPIQCGHFALTFDDSNGVGFDDPNVGGQRRNCACEVLQYIESIIEIPDGVEIGIVFFSSGAINGNPNALAAAAPYWSNGFNQHTPGIFKGDVYNYIVDGTDPNPDFQYDAHLQVNFPNFTLSTCESPIPNCSYDLYSILLHEFLHTFGLLSLVREDQNTLLPTTATGFNQFTLYDDLFLFHGDITNPISFEKIILQSSSNPILNPSISTGELRDNMWWNNNVGQFQNNQPIYSGGDYQGAGGDSFGNVLSGSFLSHMDGVRHTFTYRGWMSPGYLPHYIMKPTFAEGEICREISLPEIRMLDEMGYSLTTNYENIINNSPPYTTKQVTNPHTGFNTYLDVVPSFNFPETMPADFQIINDGNPLIINLNEDDELFDTNNDIIRVEDGTLFNIRGCGNGNNHDQLEISSNIPDIDGTQIIFTPRANFIGRAQFGFYLYDGIERGSFMVYTIDVLPGSNFHNSSNSNTPVGQNELIINGNFENGTEMKTIYNEFAPYVGISDARGRIEGEFYSGATFCDGHPFSQINWNWTTSPGTIIVDGAYKTCNFGITPSGFGVLPRAYNGPSATYWNHPISNNNNGQRYLILTGFMNYMTLAESLIPCNDYILTFDYFAKDLNSFELSIGFTDNVSSNIENLNYTFQFNEEYEDIINNTWNTVSIPFKYCSESDCMFLNFYLTGLMNDIYIDNVSITESIEQLPALSVEIGENQTICSGGNAIISTTVENEKCELAYTWQPPEGLSNPNIASPIASPESTTTYFLTVNDVNGCESVVDQVTIFVVEQETLEIQANVIEAICVNEPSFELLATPLGGIWTGDGVIDNTFNPSVANVGGHTLSYTVSNGLCSNTEFINIIVLPNPEIVISTDQNIVCPATAVFLSTTNISNTDIVDYMWSNMGSDYWTEISPLENVTISVTATGINGCIDEASIYIEVYDLNVSAGTDQTICHGEPSTLSATGGVSYTWSNGITNGTSFIPSATDTYTVTATDINGCTATDDVTITVNSPVITMPTDLFTCYGQSVTIGGTNIISNGTPPFTYTWSNSANTSSQVVTPLVTTPYSLTVSDANSCSDTETVTVTLNPQLTLTADANSFPNCPGEQTILTAHPLGGSPDYTYQWSNSLGTNQTAEVFPSENSTYSVAVSDINGCTAQASVNTEIAYSIGSIISENSCSNTDNGFITLVINANSLNSFPDPVHWSNGTVTTFTQTVANTYETTITGLAPGTYTYDVTDALGCNITGSVIIGMYSAPSIGSEVSMSCPNENTGSIVLDIANASPPYNYLWSNSAVSEDIYNLPSGNYELTFTYGNNCVDISSYFVDEEPAVELSVNNTTPTYGPELGDAAVSFSTTNVGLYDLLITNNFGYSHYQSGFTLADLLIPHIPSGLYTVQVQSANPCSYETQFSIANVFETVTNSCISGNNGTVTLDITVYGAGNTLPSIINWSEGGSSSCVIITPGAYFNKYQSVYHDLAPGTYTYTVTDAWGNTITNTVTVEAYEEPVISTYVTETCSSQPIGSIDLEITNDITPTSYLWSNGETTQDISNLESGSYNVTITYADNCELISEDISVGQYYSTEVVIDWTHPYVDPNAPYGNVGFYYSNLHPGNYTLLVTNNNNYNETFTFSSTDQLNQINGLNPGLYDMTLTDENGCFTSTQFSIDFVKINRLEPCYNSNTGEIIIDIMTYGADNGITEYMQLQSEDLTVLTDLPETISPGHFQFSFTGLSAGTYTFHVTDLWENDINSYVIVEEYPEILISVNTVPAYGTEPGVATISFNPANLVGYQVVIESTTLIEDLVFDNPVSPITVELQPGSYTVSVFNLVSDCPPFTYTFDMEDVGQILYNCLNVTPATCDHYYSGSLTFEIAGGEPPYTVFVWQGDTELLSNLLYSAPGTYIIQLPESNSTEGFVISGFDYNNHYAAGSIWLDNAYTAYNTFTNDNITNRLQAYQNHVVNQVICIGSELDQTLLFNDNVTFENCTIYTATHAYENVEETRISVRAPYDLILKDCTIESGCPDQMWQGIAAQGACGPQNVNTQSMVVVDGTTISDAMKAVELIHGAIIQASHSNFMNNQYGIFMQPHCNEQTLSYVNYNNFETSRLLNDAEIFPKAHIRMEYSKNLKLKGNNFANTINGTPVLPLNVTYTADKRGKGIEAELSSFIVTPVSIFDYHSYSANTENTFEGLYYAIDARGQKTYAPQVYHSIFRNNFRGVYLQGTDGARVLFNYISTTNEPQYFTMVGYSLDGTPNTDVSYGAYLNSAKNSKFEENTILNGKAGAYVYNLGNDGSQYYSNNFGLNPDVNAADYNLPQGMRAATVVVGQNSNFIYGSEFYLGQTGLEVRCNDYTKNYFAISVVNGNMRQNQGAHNGQTDQLAGNQFHETFINGMEFKAQEQNSGIFNYSHLNLGTYNYYQHDDDESDMNGFYRELHEENTQSVEGSTQDGVGFSKMQSCPSHYSPHIIFDHYAAISNIAVKTAKLDGLEEEYEHIVDKGDTYYMESVAKLMGYENYSEAYEILENEGYLSDTVLTALICNEIAPGDAIAAILIANSPLPEKVIKLIKDLPIDSSIKDWLSLYSAGLSSRVEMEFEMADIKQEIIVIESDLMNNAINNDSLAYVKTDVIKYFNSKPEVTYHDYINIYNLELSLDLLGDALSTLGEIRKTADSLPAEESENVRIFCDVNEIYLGSIDEKTGSSVLSANRDLLFAAASGMSADYSALAEILYLQTTDSVFYEYTPLPVEEVKPKNMAITENTPDIFTPEFKVSPNPTRGIVIVEYNFDRVYANGTELLLKALNLEKQESCNTGVIKVYNSESKLIKTIKLDNVNGLETINLNKQTAGLYLIEITDCYGNTNSVKIVKNQ